MPTMRTRSGPRERARRSSTTCADSKGRGPRRSSIPPRGTPVVGSRSERETTRTEIHISRTTDTQKQEGGAVQQQPSGPSGAPAGSPQTDHSADPGTPYVGGNYVSGRSTI